MSREAKTEILARIALALGGEAKDRERPAGDIARVYRVGSDHPAEQRLERFASRLRDYRAQVEVADAGSVASVVAGWLSRADGGSYVVPAGLPAAWRPPVASVTYVPDEELTARELSACAGVVSGCALAIADTGTIVLDGGEAQGRRAISLVPDHMVCVVRERQIVDSVPQAIRALAETMRGGAAALTFVSGPSATSDIELRRVEGVHGPRRLDVVLVRGA